jgi:CheY-like chemotaxis protein
MSLSARPSLSQETKRDTILIVEDDDEIGRVMVMTLEQETAYAIRLVATCQEALLVVQELTPTVFLLDYQLPLMSGLQLYDQFQAIQRLRSIPAILVSANLPSDELEKRHMLGLSKPFDLNDLLQTVEQAVSTAC